MEKFVEQKICMNQLVEFLHKNPEDFTKADIIRFVEENEIRMLNFRYVAGDGRLKTLNFDVTNEISICLFFFKNL